MKCHVKYCKNHDHQGLFIGIVCSPCYEFLSIGRGKHSQLYRNTVAAEREACAKVCESLENDMVSGKRTKDGDQAALTAAILSERIRARGQHD